MSALLEALGLDVYTVTVGDYVPEWVREAAKQGEEWIDWAGGGLDLTYAGAAWYSVGDRVRVVVRGEEYIGIITARGRDVELYADFPAGLRQIKARIEA